jgi:hypothetical protein
MCLNVTRSCFIAVNYPAVRCLNLCQICIVCADPFDLTHDLGRGLTKRSKSLACTCTCLQLYCGEQSMARAWSYRCSLYCMCAQ